MLFYRRLDTFGPDEGNIEIRVEQYMYIFSITFFENNIGMHTTTATSQQQSKYIDIIDYCRRIFGMILFVQSINSCIITEQTLNI